MANLDKILTSFVDAKFVNVVAIYWHWCFLELDL